MAERDPVTTVEQILDRIAEARSIRRGRQRHDLDQDLVFRLAVERIVEVVGEAANRLPEAIRTAWPEVPWHRIIGMRNWLAHGYDVVDPEVLWDVLSCRLDEVEPVFCRVREALKNKETL